MTQQDGSSAYGTGEQPVPPHPAGSAQPYAQPYGQAYPQPYGQPYQAYGYPPVVVQRTNGLAVASLVLGILWLYWIGSVLALVFGYVAKKQIRERGESGSGMATAGIVLGWVGVGILVLGVLFGVAAYSSV